MKRLLLCGMLLVFVSGMCVAQAVHRGVAPMARTTSSARIAPAPVSIAPNARVGTGIPNARVGAPTHAAPARTTKVSPNAARTARPNTAIMPPGVQGTFDTGARVNAKY